MYWLARMHPLRFLLAIAACLILVMEPGRTQKPAAATSGMPPSAGPVTAPLSAGARCVIPAGLLSGAPGALANTARALHPGGHLRILAVGSALVGPHLGADEAFPRRMVDTLRHLAPGVTVQLDMRSDRGATAAELVPILRTELDSHVYQLVLWQTGTVDAARKLRLQDFGRALADGVKTARAKGSDVMLIDPQFSRLLEERADLAPYEARIAQEARSPNTQLFPRFALMQHWVETGSLDVEKAPRDDRRATIVRLHECLADALAHAIVAGATPPAGSQASE